MFNQMQIVNKKDGRVLIFFPMLSDVGKDISIKKVYEISHIFSENFYFKLTYKRKANIFSSLKGIKPDNCFTHNVQKNSIATIFKSNIDLLPEIIRQLNFEDVCLEIIVCNRTLSLEQAINLQEESINFIFVFSDNDGPYIIFNSFKFDRSSTIARIKEIIKSRI